ncbi:MAG: sugar ABC transporter permease [Mesorhizobium sp.]|uniref:carbohydrate ABC transporter permease n=1 Tax=Mesorhizobium sp. TaxID=1871066 RepID=UPI000FE42ECA|nr:sugar ABC transporter permease [Mesorhizobium sp.]RWJ04414.1 MAG: sugar ABC transporter permease [Mesorhizobium sp.]RWJ15177.1 MAG: sugar ABC transporter permease [Mesorhizobium sp.]
MVDIHAAETGAAHRPLPRLHSKLKAQRVRSAWLFVAPTLMVLALVAAWPLARTIYLSFTNASLGNFAETEFIGLQNYFAWSTLNSGRTIFRGLLADPLWWNAVWNTLKFTVISVSFQTVLGLIIALALNLKFPGRGIVRATILIPWALPGVVSAKMWTLIFNDQFGIFNDALMRLGLITQKVAWLASSDTMMPVVLVVAVWMGTPFMAILTLAALQSVPGDIYEAAKIDGVHPVKVFWRVTLPLIRPALMVAIIFRIMDALRVFDLIYVMTPSSSETVTMSVLTQQYLFGFDRFGYGCAASTVLFLIVAFVIFVYIKVGRVTGEAGER